MTRALKGADRAGSVKAPHRADGWGTYQAYQSPHGQVLFADVPDTNVRRKVFDLRLMAWTAGFWLAAVAVMVLAPGGTGWALATAMAAVPVLLLCAWLVLPSGGTYLLLFGCGWIIAALRVGLARWRVMSHWITTMAGNPVYLDRGAGMRAEGYARLLRSSTPQHPLYGVDVSIPGYPTDIFLLGGPQLAGVHPGDALRGLVKVNAATRPGLSSVMFSGAGVEIDQRAGGLAAMAATARDDIARAVTSTPAGALVQGMVTGDTSAQSAADQQSFVDAGLSHLTAVSGANVAIVVATVGALIAAPRIKVAAVALSIVVFVLIAGAEPSVLRAAITAGLALCVGCLGRTREALSTVAAAAGIVILWHPPMAVHVGFLLSVSATLGILILGPVFTSAITRRIPRRVGATRWGRAMISSVAVTAAAECSTLPVLWLVLGTFRGASAVANLLAGPAVPPVTVVGTAALLLCLASRMVPGGWLGESLGDGLRELASWALMCLNPLAAWIRLVANTASSWTWLAVDSPAWSATWGVVFAVAWGWCGWRILRREMTHRRIVAVAAVMVYLVCATVRAFP